MEEPDVLADLLARDLAREHEHGRGGGVGRAEPRGGVQQPRPRDDEGRADADAARPGRQEVEAQLRPRLHVLAPLPQLIARQEAEIGDTWFSAGNVLVSKVADMYHTKVNLTDRR